MASGAWQHFIPAAYIAGFGDPQSDQRRRKTLVWVARRSGRVFRQTAERVGAAKNLYTLDRPSCIARNTNLDVLTPPFPLVSNTDPHIIDALWSEVERRLPEAIAELRDGRGFLDAGLWVGTLVPFVAHSFVRSPDFGQRFEDRFNARFGGPSPIPHDKDRLNTARLIEMRRLSGLVMRAEWSLVYTPSCSRIVTNDLGRAIFCDQERGNRIAHLIPLRHDLALQLVRGQATHQLHRGINDKWTVGPFREHATDQDGVEAINGALAQLAYSEIYGWPETLIRGLHVSMGLAPSSSLAEPRLTETPGEARIYEDLQLQLLQYISAPPSKTPGPFSPTLNIVPAGASTLEKVMNFPLPAPRSKEAVSIFIQSHRLAIDETDGYVGLDGSSIVDGPLRSKLLELMGAALDQGARVEELVYIRAANGDVCQYEYTTAERFGWVGQNRRTGCCIFIAGVDRDTMKPVLRHIEWVPLSGPYPIGPLSP